jgi:DNA gyrase subunit B
MDFYEDFDVSQSQIPMTPREHVRKRPAMYLGGTDRRALGNLLDEIVNVALEDVLVGRCDHIWIELRPDQEVCIFDNSIGLPMKPYKDTAFTQMEVIMQSVGISKADLEPDIYRIAPTKYVHTLGAGIVNPLCAEMLVENAWDGVLWRQTYAAGKPTSAPTRVPNAGKTISGTTFTFKPDFTIFEPNEFDRERIEKRARELAYLLPNLTIQVRDLRVDPSHEVAFYAPDGLTAWVQEQNAGREVLHDVIRIRQDVPVQHPRRDEVFTLGVDIAFQFTTGEESRVNDYVNTVETPDGGTHLLAFQAAILAALNEHLIHHPPESENTKPFTWPEVSCGLSACIAVQHPEPESSPGAMWLTLDNPEIFGPVAGVVFSTFKDKVYYPTLAPIAEHYLSRR